MKSPENGFQNGDTRERTSRESKIGLSRLTRRKSARGRRVLRGKEMDEEIEKRRLGGMSGCREQTREREERMDNDWFCANVCAYGFLMVMGKFGVWEAHSGVLGGCSMGQDEHKSDWNEKYMMSGLCSISLITR